MSQFECPVVRVAIEPHPNADAIELACIGGYVSIVKKGQFEDGDFAVYVPEQAVLPEWLLKALGFWDELNGKGQLSGSKGNRVRAIKLRGVLSQGLLVPLVKDPEGPRLTYPEQADGRVGHWVKEGENAAEYLGVVKYEPEVPVQLRAKVAGGDLDATIGYDFDNIKKHPNLFDDVEEVVITEKLHGTCLQVGLIPPELWQGKAWAEKCPDFGLFKGVVTSKGQGAKGLMIDPSDEGNLYVSIVRQYRLWDKLVAIHADLGDATQGQPLFLFGEIFGAGVQDLTYGWANPVFRAFDMHIGTRSAGTYVHYDDFMAECDYAQIERVPLLYRGPFDAGKLAELTDGTTVFTNKQIREGVVVRDVRSSASNHPRYGRRIAKSVSAAYLLRKNATEFN